MKTLFRNCIILLRESDGTYHSLKNAFLGVDGDVFSYIGAEEPTEKYDKVKDLSGKLVMPGLYNCHTHSPMVLFRGAGSDKPLEVWLNNYIFPLESKLTAEQVELASYLAIMEMLASGTVSFSDMYFFPEETANAVAKSKIKANLTKHIQSLSGEYTPKQINDSLEFIKKYDKTADGRILADFSIHSQYLCDKQTAKEYSEICKNLGGRLHIHLSETRSEFDECLNNYHQTPTEWFAEVGALIPGTFAAHCVAMSENDMKLLADNKVSVVHNPTSNLKLGSGFSPVPEMIEKGINLTLGTDGAASNNNLNLFEEIHLASLIHNGRLKNPTIMNSDTVLDMATINAAKLQGRENCGEIKVGNKADFIALDLDKPHLQSDFDEKNLITYSAQGSDVYMTVVDGNILYQNGEFFTIDKEKIMFRFKEIIKH